MVWHGWGDPARRHGVPPDALAMLRRELDLPERSTPPVPEAEVRMRPSSLSADFATRLAGVVGAENVRGDRATRLLHAGGKNYPDLLRRRTGDAEDAPDAVVLPGSHDEVSAVLGACSEAGVAVVPFGGGTSVVGGVEPVRGRFVAVIALDLARLDRLVSLDRESLTATLGAGLRGPQAEALLADHGLTLGHFPQSYEHATIGGYAATRSAGQASTGYGRFDELVVGVRMATPAGELALDHGPASAAGPDLRSLVVGSEGVFGVITEVTVRVRVQPERRVYEGWFFRSFADGVAALRALAQERVAPDVVRLSDEEETRVTLALAGGGGGLKRRLGALVMRVRGYTGGCLVVVGWEGTPTSVTARRGASSRVLRRCGGLRLGEGVGRAWERGRFDGPYLRDELMDRGVFVETLETAAPWARLRDVHAAVGGALRGALTTGGTAADRDVPCLAPLRDRWLALLHVCRSGPGRPRARAVAGRQDRCLRGDRRGRRHHHPPSRGRHRPRAVPLRPRSVTSASILRAVKERLDPTGILNPGKLIP